MSDDDLLKIALEWAARGVPVFPVGISPKVDKPGTDKRPLTHHGFYDAATTGADVADLMMNPPVSLRRGEVKGVAARPGPAGFVVVDLDLAREGRDAGLATAQQLGLTNHTFMTATGSGGEHRWFRKFDPEARVTNYNPWEKQGIDIRGDNGYVVVAASTPWGEWREHPDSTGWGNFATLPENVWGELNAKRTSATSSAWSLFDPDVHLPQLHPAVPELLDVLRSENADVLAFRTRGDGGEPYLEITCNGKTLSATLGYVGPTTLYVFSASWPNRPSGAQDVIPLGSFDPAIEGKDAAEQIDLDRLHFEAEVCKELRTLQVRDEAKRRQRNAHQPIEPFDALLLDDIVDEPTQWRIDGLLPAQGRMLITAMRKTGKTTATLNLARDLITGRSFLEHFPVEPVQGRVGFMNFEVSRSQFARWAREVDIAGDRLYTVHLRGRTNPFSDKEHGDQLAALLREHEVEVLIVDPFGRAYTGKSQRDEGEVGEFLGNLDRFADAAGVNEMVLTAHAGWEGERTRGSSALEDWPDSIAYLTKDDEDTRYFRAIGRDVEVEEDRLNFDPTTRQLSLTGAGSRKAATNSKRLAGHVAQLVEVVRDRPGVGVNEIEAAWKVRQHPHQKGDGSRASKEAERQGLVRVEKGSRNARTHYLPSVTPTNPDQPQQGHSPLTPTAPIGAGLVVGQSDLLSDSEHSGSVNVAIQQFPAAVIGEMAS